MIEFEIVKHDKMKDIRVLINSIKMRSLHMHHDIELIYVLNGKGSISIKNKQYEIKKGDTILINAYESHEIIANKESLIVIIVQFSNHFLKDYYHLLRNIIFNDVLIQDKMPKKQYILLQENIIELSKQYLKADEMFELNCVKLLSDILYLLLKYTNTSKLQEAEYSKRKKQNHRLERISSYINSHYQEPIRLDDIAKIEGISTTHLSHFISDNFGKTFQEYLKDKRLECALRMINDDSLTLSEISARSGFSELKYMNNAFKETFGISPNEYRNQNLISLPINKEKDVFEYIYDDKEALAIFF